MRKNQVSNIKVEVHIQQIRIPVGLYRRVEKEQERRAKGNKGAQAKITAIILESLDAFLSDIEDGEEITSKQPNGSNGAT